MVHTHANIATLNIDDFCNFDESDAEAGSIWSQHMPNECHECIMQNGLLST